MQNGMKLWTTVFPASWFLVCWYIIYKTFPCRISIKVIPHRWFRNGQYSAMRVLHLTYVMILNNSFTCTTSITHSGQEEIVWWTVSNYYFVWKLSSFEIFLNFFPNGPIKLQVNIGLDTSHCLNQWWPAQFTDACLHFDGLDYVKLV